MSIPYVSQLYVYPVKSARGISLDSAHLDGRGIHLDRRWMLVDSDARFLTQREIPRLSLIQVESLPTHLRITAPAMPALTVPLIPPERKPLTVIVWKDAVKALDMGEATSAWFTKFLGVTCSLVYMPEGSLRPVHSEYASPSQQVGFADAFPLLLISEGSLADLNSRLDEPLPMNRFRPNIVVTGCAPFAEDGWKEITIGDVRMSVAKPCARCITTTVDQATGIRGKEPLATLARYRTRDNKVLFGQNLIHQSAGTLRVGDAVKVTR